MVATVAVLRVVALALAHHGHFLTSVVVLRVVEWVALPITAEGRVVLVLCSRVLEARDSRCATQFVLSVQSQLEYERLCVLVGVQKPGGFSF